MPYIRFTDNLHRHLDCPAGSVTGNTVRAALEVVFEGNAMLRSYVLDDQGGLRRHVNIFINDAAVRDRQKLSDPVSGNDEIFVMQALSGG